MLRVRARWPFFCQDHRPRAGPTSTSWWVAWSGASGPGWRGLVASRSVLYADRPVAEQAEWLDVGAAARHLGVNPDAIYRMIRMGHLTALRFPIRIRREDLDACLERCRIKPGDLAHLNVYAAGAHLAAERAVTKAGRPDRRYGPRQVRGAASDTGGRSRVSAAEPPPRRSSPGPR